eukprot:CAMPEP_0114612702 /NCGR_PEP_ID=MMETSP0168-20121206/4756_1 /TAXON_ID=95228 ORGANISM="Vannella sp., Strain DIVA3 517/6/12" /NCGR_SAMPLE_ID=MMETSP0168 /ASSEMBLY_ACC=CAM_ASM_000044 /LENGTH=90 /DNA_ID=CAMNT_0001823691 /DNA_START=162 /DNA_END=434 /DNA_ORIENTATION=+
MASSQSTSDASQSTSVYESTCAGPVRKRSSSVAASSGSVAGGSLASDRLQSSSRSCTEGRFSQLQPWSPFAPPSASGLSAKNASPSSITE